MQDGNSVHKSVLATEVVEGLCPRDGSVLVDGTLGGGGHTRMLAERVGTAGRLIGLDRDPAAIERVQQTIGTLPITLVQANFRDVAEVIEHLGIRSIDGVLLDLGLSSDQLANSQRGFSFSSSGDLDLRFDPDEGEPASRLLATLPEKKLADLIFEYGEERFSRRIAKQIVAARRETPFRTADQLADLVSRCVPRGRNHRIHPATRTFQALRIAVNDELGALQEALREFPSLLAPGGRVVVISFHSLEDRIVKHAFRDDPNYVILTKKPIRPNETEINLNPRCRSARLRVAEKVR